MNSAQTKSVKLGIRKGDTVTVIAGRERLSPDSVGKVLKVDTKNMRVLVEKKNMVKRHIRPNQQNPQGGYLEKESYLHYSNVQLFCPKCNRGVRFGVKVAEDKKHKGKTKKVRVCRRCDNAFDA